MERLTSKYWRNLDPWEMCGQDNYCKRGCHEQGGCTKGCIVPRIYARLAAYEDSGLEPGEIADFMKLWVHTVEIGGMIKKYCIDHIRDLLQAEQDGRLVVLPCKVGDKVYQTDGVRLYESTVRSLIFDTENVAFDEGAIGKTVFLTREDAEAALKGSEG